MGVAAVLPSHSHPCGVTSHVPNNQLCAQGLHPDAMEKRWRADHRILRGGPSEKYTWRLSVADIGGDGPFSGFVGMNRLISVIQGNGVRLDLGGHSSEVLVPFQTLMVAPTFSASCETVPSKT